MADRGPSVERRLDEEGRPLCGRETCPNPIVGRRAQARFCSDECTLKGQVERKQAQKAARPVRTCFLEGCENPLTYDARQRYCSPECSEAGWKESERAWRAANPERLKELRNKSRRNNIEKDRERDRKRSKDPKRKTAAKRYAAGKKEELSVYLKEYRAKNHERVLARERAYRAANPEWHERRREAKLLKNFGITIEQYDQMHTERNGLCDICKHPETAKRNGKTKRLAVDHDHSKKLGEPGYIRGLLCQRCNQWLGHLEKPEWRRLAEAYLAKPAPAIPAATTTLKRHHWGRFRLTVDQYDKMLEERGGVCEICGEKERGTYKGRPRNLAVDHDHDKTKGEAGHIRGLLCSTCNQQLWALEEKNWFIAAEAYRLLPRT